MNKIFKVIWNNAKRCYVVASELAKSHSKSKSSRTIRKSIAALGIALAVYAATGSALAENTGGHIEGINYIGDSPYNVTIDSNVTGSVYGRKEDSNTSEKATVTISSETVELNVYGGYSNSGNAASNSVTITGGTVELNVYVGDSNSGNAVSNSVTITGGTVELNVYVGDSYSGNAASNSVIISGGTVKGDVYSGYSYSGNAASNSVIISGGTIGSIDNNGDVYGGDVYSGNSYSGNAASNSVRISGGTMSNVYGGISFSGNAASNSVRISGGTMSNVCGGVSYSGNAASNSVNISSGIVKCDIYGGYVSSGSGNAASNSVNITGGTINQHVFGGRSNSGNAASNSVNISGDTTNILGNIYGGVASGTGNAYENKVNTATGTLKIVYGGYSELGSVASNSVNISGDTTKINEVYGGYVNSGTGSASYNILNISSGTLNVAYGGVASGTGDANKNQVVMTGGEILFDDSLIDNSGNLYGGYSSLGNASSNSIDISCDNSIILNVYGGVASSTGNANNNYVNIASIEKINNIYGGNSESGNAVENSLNICSGNFGNLYGGYVQDGSGDATSNSVKIIDGSFDSVYGGYINDGSGNAASNSVDISGGTINFVVLGGRSESGDSVNNSVTISGGKIIGNLDHPSAVHGGISNSGRAVDNSVTIKNGTVDYVYGGDSDSGDATSNSVTISGGTVNNFVYGGFSFSGKATSNNIIISGGTIKEDIKGGESGSGDATSNSVTISGGTVNGSVTAGYSSSDKATSNSINISGGTVGSVIGGNSDSGSCTSNSINISGGTVGSVQGGYVGDGSGEVSCNSVTISGGTINGSIFGGRCDSGNSVSNTVTISGGTLNGEVYGGFAYEGNATNNSVNISGGTFTSESKFYAGDILTPSNSTISDNLINLTGNVIGFDRVDIYGYYFEEGSGTHSGNELHIGRAVDYDDEGNIQRDSEGNIKYKSDSSTTWYGKSSDGTANNSINKIANFETLALHSVAWDNDLPAIKAASLENIGTVDITDLKFYENSSEKTTFNIGDKMNLLKWENEKEALINLKYKLNGTGDEQTTAFSDNPNGITVKTLSVSEKDKGISFEGTGTGDIKKVDKALEFSFASITLNSIDLSDWDGKNTSEFPDGWVANTDGVNVSGDFADPGLSAGESINILTASTDVFKDEKIDEAIRYKNEVFKDESAKGVTLSGIHTGGVKASDDGKILTYQAMFDDVTSFKLASVAWEDGAELISRDKYNYSKLTTLDTEDFNITYEKPETITINQSMTILNANNTLADMAKVEKSKVYSYTPVSGVTMDAIIRSSLEVKSGKVTLTAVSHNADKLTFGDVEWKDKGALLDHKTLYNNITLSGADVDTTRIAFTNKDEIEANMQMTLVSDFGDSVGTITGSKYKVGTAYEGEGSAYLDGSDLVFKTKTSAGISEQTHTTVMAMEAGIAALAAGNDYIGTVMEGLGMTANKGSDGVSTAASFGGGASRYETGSHVDTNSWNIAVAVGKNLEKKDGTLEYGLFGEYGRGNYTLHMNGVEDAGSGNIKYSGGGLMTKFTNKHGVYTEASFRLGRMENDASNILHDGAGNAYGYDKKTKYKGVHFGFGKKYKEDENTELEIFGKFYYNQREGFNFAAGADQYSLDDVRSRVLRAGFRLASTDRKWNRYGGIAYDHEFGGKSTGTVNGAAIRSASIKGGTIRGEFGIRREATKTNPWKTDISLYGFTGKRQGFGGNIAFEYQF